MKPARTPRPAENPTAALEQRVAELQKWLQESAPECFSDQTQLDEGTPERSYWHYGYLVALRDVLALLSGQRRSLH